MSARSEFLAGERPEDVAFYLHEDTVGNPDALSEYAEPVSDGLVLVIPGDDGRGAFQAATGVDPMALAREAMGTEGEIDRDLTGGTCPNAGSESDENPSDDAAAEASEHTATFVFAFAEEQNEDVGGLYAEGDVVHAYAACRCGERYSEKWVLEDER